MVVSHEIDESVYLQPAYRIHSSSSLRKTIVLLTTKSQNSFSICSVYLSLNYAKIISIRTLESRLFSYLYI